MNPLKHVAIIMDGNGRWGLKYKNSRNAGHKEGVKTVEKIIKASIKNKIKFLTLYAFSTENWKRPKKEINYLFNLLESFLKDKIERLHKQNIKLKIIGEKKFSNKIIHIKCCYRSNKNDAFEIYPRDRHRYKLGREALLETLLLSKCDHFIYLCSNVSSAAISFNLNTDQKRIEIKNGINSKNILIAQFLWYLKSMLPKSFGGL